MEIITSMVNDDDMYSSLKGATEGTTQRSVERRNFDEKAAVQYESIVKSNIFSAVVIIKHLPTRKLFAARTY